jgi:hypothetical protein
MLLFMEKSLYRLQLTINVLHLEMQRFQLKI